MNRAYGDDLAYIHDAGFGQFARHAAPCLLKFLRQRGLEGGRVVDLGCGSGIFAQELTAAGCPVVGIDLSPGMIALARQRVPLGEFHVGSFLKFPIPPCAAVTAIGECFSYLFDPGNTDQQLGKLFQRIHAALQPGGFFMFDVVAPGRVRGRGPQRHWREGDDWAVLVEAEEDRERGLLTRRIASFRKIDDLYRRDYEIHRQRLFDGQKLAEQLRGMGFRVRRLAGYGTLRFARGQIGFLARKSPR